MATVTKPIALDESINTTENTPRNIADVLADELSNIADKIQSGGSGECARKADLTNLDLTGTTNTTGSTISSGTYFYLNGVLVRAKTAIASGATFTLNTNYEVVTAGALNDLGVQIGDCTKTSVESITFTYSNYGLWHLNTSKFIVAVNDANRLITGGKSNYHRIYSASTSGITPVDPSESPLTLDCVVQS